MMRRIGRQAHPRVRNSHRVLARIVTHLAKNLSRRQCLREKGLPSVLAVSSCGTLVRTFS